jgi:hypothetical protein
MGGVLAEVLQMAPAYAGALVLGGETAFMLLGQENPFASFPVQSAPETRVG